MMFQMNNAILGLLALIFGILIIMIPELLGVLVGLYLILFGFVTLLKGRMIK